MRGFLGFVGMTVGSAIGWWLGAFVGLGTAVVISGIGTGVGLYYGRRLADYLM
jgi:hypothetical protein